MTEQNTTQTEQTEQTAEQKRAAMIEAALTGETPDLKAEDAEVTTKDAKGTEHKRPYRKLTALTPRGMAILSGNSTETMLGHFNYAFDLSVRGTVRQALVASLEGPEKVIKQTAEKLVAAQLFDTYEEARADVVAKRLAKGLPV